jgi:hypothetical protein
MKPADGGGESRQLTARVIVEPIPDEITGLIITAGRIGLAGGEYIKSLFRSVQNLRCLAPYSFCIDCSCPNVGQKNGERI